MKLKSLLIIFDCFLLINCLKEENTDVTVNLYGLYDEHIGKKGTVVLECTPALDFPIVDTSKKVRFQLSITNGKNYLSVGCGFFKTEREDLYVFCNVDETIPAGNYTFAKDVIKLINAVGKVVNSDPEVSKFINVFFIPNYRVTIAEKLMPAADVSEQISTAGKEASGTGNMKFMMNGAITLGTLDGANVEIKGLVGDDNIVIFGLNEQEVSSLKPIYRPYDYYLNNPEIKEIIDSLTDGTFSEDKKEFEDISNEFLLRNDEYMLLADLESYKKAHDEIYKIYSDKKRFAKICLTNIAKSSFFSSDRTINDYVEDIWHLDKLF